MPLKESYADYYIETEGNSLQRCSCDHSFSIPNRKNVKVQGRMKVKWAHIYNAQLCDLEWQ